MAKGFKHGAGGGSGGLNFKVICNPQPSTAKENTIRIDTDTFTSWIFSATEPEAPEEGMVWFTNGTSSSVEFNALKKNGLQVYPISAKQYIGGVWVDKSAKSYQGGAWVDLASDCYLYNSGDQCSDITGGWGKSDWTWAGNANSINGRTINSDNIKLSANPPTYAAAVGTNNKVNFSGYSTLEVTYDMDQGSGFINITTSKAANLDSGSSIANASFTETGNNKTASISLKGVDSHAYICVVSNSLNTLVIHSVLLKV
jgi:hypothetical protein